MAGMWYLPEHSWVTAIIATFAESDVGIVSIHQESPYVTGTGGVVLCTVCQVLAVHVTDFIKTPPTRGAPDTCGGKAAESKCEEAECQQVSHCKRSKSREQEVVLSRKYT